MAQPIEVKHERQLVHEVKRGSVAAFEALYRAHVGRVHAICSRMCRDEHRAAEVTQEVFLRAWEKIGTFEERSAFGSWLYSLAMRTSIDHLRRERRRDQREIQREDAGMAPSPRAPSSNPEARLDLEAAIASLPPQARAVLVMHDIEGFAHYEIAAMLDIAVGTSKAHLFHARRLLRAKLGA